MAFILGQTHQPCLAHLIQRLAVLLGQGQEEALPGYRHLSLLCLERKKIFRHSSGDSAGEGVVFVEQCREVVDGWGRWRHLHEFEHGDRGTDDGYGHLAE